MLCLLLPTGCAPTGRKSEPVAGCQAQIAWQITPGAEITQFDCRLAAFGAHLALIFDVTIRNVADVPRGYRINIFLLDQDKAAGYRVPRQGNPPEVAPGQSATVQIPFIAITQIPGELLVVVKPLD
jgi:hypothetical protein